MSHFVAVCRVLNMFIQAGAGEKRALSTEGTEVHSEMLSWKVSPKFSMVMAKRLITWVKAKRLTAVSPQKGSP